MKQTIGFDLFDRQSRWFWACWAVSSFSHPAHSTEHVLMRASVFSWILTTEICADTTSSRCSRCFSFWFWPDWLPLDFSPFIRCRPRKEQGEGRSSRLRSCRRFEDLLQKTVTDQHTSSKEFVQRTQNSNSLESHCGSRSKTLRNDFFSLSVDHRRSP